MFLGFGLNLAGGMSIDSIKSLVAIKDVSGQQTMPSSYVSKIKAIPGVDTVLNDPALITGTLPNGIRYYIRASTNPANRARLWLAVDAGAIQEDEDQRGFAHFLEHMAFNGTTHFPKNTLIDFIEQAGMQFGGDLNAYTSYDETVYQLTVPTDDEEVLGQGLQVLYDWASGGITIDSLDVIEERGVVMGEWRMRNPDTASLRLQELQLGIILGDSSRYLKRSPIGLTRLLTNALPAPIRRFYRDWYRPDLTAIIAVGDFDPVQMRNKIEARFGKIPAVSNPRQFIRPSAPAPTTPIVHVIKDRVGPSIEVTWDAKQTPREPVLALQQMVMETLVFQHLQRVFLKMSKQERRPFAGASARRTQGIVRQLGERYTIGVVATPDSLERAFIAMLTEIERVAQHGIPADILEREKATLLRQVEHIADARNAIPSQQLAQSYVRHYLDKKDGALLSPQQELALLKQLLPTVTSEATKKTAAFWRTSGPPTVTVMMPIFAHIRTPTRDIMLALLDSVAKSSIPEQMTTTATVAAIPMKAASDGVGRIINEQLFKVSGITAWTLSNGLRVLFKQTNVNADELVLQAGSLGGTSRLPDSLFFTPGRFVGSLMTSAGGLGDHDRDALKRTLSTTALQELRVAINVFDEEIAVAGSPKELETLFQLMYLQFTAPKIDTTTLAEWKRTGAGTLTVSSNDKLAASLANGEPRLMSVSRNTVNMLHLINPTQAMMVYRDRFGDPGDFTFMIVGAVSPQKIKPLVEQYLATLPNLRRPEREQPRDLKIEMPQNRRDIRFESPNIPPEKAQNRLLFDGVLSAVPAEALREQRVLSTLSYILSNRLRNRLREEMGVTYGISAPVQFYRNPHPRYRMDVVVLTAPDRIDESVTNIWQIIDAIREDGVTPDELARATTVAQRVRENAMQDNRWWVAQMLRYDQAGLSMNDIAIPTASQVTADDVKAAARKYLTKDLYYQQTVLPTKEKIEEYEKDAAKKDKVDDSTTVSSPR